MLTNRKIFGLDVNRTLADVEDADASLRNIGVEPRDLAVIFGASQVPVTSNDFRSLVRLKQPLYKLLDRYRNDSSQYGSILDKRAGTDNLLFGNLNINGRLSGSAIRYRFLKGEGNSAEKKIADISTSRVSAWSSSDPHAETDQRAAISYGAKIDIIASASGMSHLKFGTQATSSNTNGLNISGTPRLQTTLVPQKVEFDSEIPTSKVKVRMGSDDVWLYAMKGIPVSFTGFFRNLYNAQVSVAGIDAGGTKGVIQPSWKIKRTDNPNDYANYKNATNVTYYSSRGRERNIEIYYPPDSILSINITSANIAEMPVAKFATLTTLNLSSNRLKNFPDLNSIAPSIVDLNLSYNNFWLSETSTERKLRKSGGTTILDKIPSTLKYINIAGNFYGSIDDHIFADRFGSNLITFNLARGGGAYFHPDDQTSKVPTVGPNVETYSIYGNDFRSFSASDTGNGRYSVKELTKLKGLTLGSNYYLSDSGLSSALVNGLSSNLIESVNIYATNLPILNMANKTSLITFNANYTRNAGTLFSGSTYKFNNCSSLTHLYLYAASFTGAFPKFTNEKLTYLDMRYNSMSGGGPTSSTTDTEAVLPKDTFASTPKLQTFYFISGSVITKKIHEDAFIHCPDLTNLYWYSYNTTTGALPDLTNCGNLHWLHMSDNKFEGSMPTFSVNSNIGYIYLHNNNLTGTIPELKNLSSLDYLYLYNNQFTGLEEFGSLPNLRRFYCHINNIQGQIPDFTDCPRMQYLALFRNQFSAYAPGSFSQLWYIRYIDVSNNKLPQSSINKIVDDLYDNWTNYKRGGVSINLRNNTAIGASIKTLPGIAQLDKIYEMRAGGWSITID